MAAPPHLIVSIPAQGLTLCLGNSVLHAFSISTSKFGIGTSQGSNHTPTGRFVVSEKHGAQAPLGTKFVGRVPQGICDPTSPDEQDHVLTRILRLSGLDAANANTYERYIYLHGTNQEERIGTPASHGCIRMKNEDIIALYDLVPIGTTVTISD